MLDEALAIGVIYGGVPGVRTPPLFELLGSEYLWTPPLFEYSMVNNVLMYTTVYMLHPQYIFSRDMYNSHMAHSDTGFDS